MQPENGNGRPQWWTDSDHPDEAVNERGASWRKAMRLWIRSEELRREGKTPAQRRQILNQEFPYNRRLR